MAQQEINVGAAPNDGDGNPLRTAFIKCNDNFGELYSRAQSTPPPSLVGSIGDFAGMYAYDSSYFYYCFANYNGSSTIWAQVTQVGNISVSSISSGTSNIALTDVNGNAVISVGGVANVAVFTTTAQLVSGAISAAGNITGSFILGNGSQLTGLPETYANANVAAYLPIYTGNISANNIFVTTQLTSATISATANVTGGNILSSGIISTGGNVAAQGKISATGNIETAGYFVGTFVGNVTGNFVVPGANTQVIFNTNGNADATAGMTFNTNGPNLFTVLGTISSQGNVVAGNITTSNVVTATGNITGGNIITAGVVTAAGNVIGGNFNTSGLITATGNIITAGVVTAAGNVIGGNMRTGGLITATGNITGGNLRATTDIDAGGNVSATGFTGTTVGVSGNVSATGFTGTTVSVTGNVTGGNVRTAGLITATGNITGNYFIGNGSQLSGIDTTQIQNGNSNIKIATAGSNIVVNVNGVSPLALFTNIGLYVDGTGVFTGNASAGNVSATTVSATTMTATGNVTGGNVTTAGLITAAGNVIGGNLIFNSGIVSGTGNITGGNVRVGTGTVLVGNIVNANANGVGNIGNSTGYFNTVFAMATSAQYADLAENYTADRDYSAGTVVVFGGDQEVTICTEFADPRVAGVVSTNPAHLMNAGATGLPIALRGRVPVNVVGPITKGDGLVTDSLPGHAKSIQLNTNYGQAVFAKSLETNLDPGVKVIQAVIL